MIFYRLIDEDVSNIPPFFENPVSSSTNVELILLLDVILEHFQGRKSI